MSLGKWLEERRFKRNIEAAERERDRPGLEAEVRKARFEGYRQAKISQARKEGRRQAMQPGIGGRVLGTLQNLGEGAQRMESGLFGDYDPFGPRRTQHRKKKKGKGKTITIHVK